MTKKKVIGVQSGVSADVLAAGDQWVWGRKVEVGGRSVFGDYHHGGLCVSYSKAEADAHNMGDFYWPTIYPKGDGRSSTYYYVKHPESDQPKVPRHYETGNDKYYRVGDNMDGWMYQTKNISKWSDVHDNRNKIFWMDVNGKRNNKYDICWTSMCDITTPYDNVVEGATVNNDPKKSAWWSHIAYSSSSSNAPIGHGVVDTRKIVSSRMKNVVGFSMNAAWNGKDGNSLLAPWTIGMIMHKPNTRKLYIVIPTERGPSSIELNQKIDNSNYWGTGREDSILEGNIRAAKGKIQKIVYTCSRDVIDTIVNDNLEFLGLWWKLGKIGQGGSTVHAWGAMGAWNFRPHCVGPDKSLSSTWNSGRYNIVPIATDDMNRSRGLLYY